MRRRRDVLIGGGALLATPAWAAPRAFGGTALAAGVAALERESRGRLGVAILDTGDGARFGWRARERFAMCSTFKLPLAAAILERVASGGERLDRRLPVPAAALVENSPFSETRVGGDATLAELCEAAVTRSDNAAANLLLPLVGGAAGLTRSFRRWGDRDSRLDRIEPDLNDVAPGDPRDSTTPAAMLALLDRLTRGPLLTPPDRSQLIAWLAANRTGARRIKAGLPTGWRIGDKTGASSRGIDNDVAILWPPRRAPLLVAAYLAETPLALAESNAIHARLGALIAAAAA